MRPTLLLLLGLLGPACSPTQTAYAPDAVDAGDRAWLRQVIPMVLGRKPLSLAEIAGLERLLQKTDRATVLDALFQREEFNDYWSIVLLDDLRVDRVGEWAPSNVATCTESPLTLSTSALRRQHAASLVGHIRYGDLGQRWCEVTAGPGDVGDILTLGDTPEMSGGSLSRESASSEVETGGAEAGDGESAVYEPAGEPIRGPLEGQLVVDPWLPGDEDYELAGIIEESDGTEESDESRQLAELEAEYRARLDEVGPDADARREITAEYAERERGIKGTKTCYDFNLADVLVASVEADDLSAAWLAGLVQAATLGPNQAEVKTASIGKVSEAWLGRNPECLACHTGSFSVSNDRPLNGMFDRTHPTELWDQDPDLRGGPAVELDLEMGAFHAVNAAGLVDMRHGIGYLTVLNGYLHGGTLGSKAAPGVSPWGIDPTCVQGRDSTGAITVQGILSAPPGGTNGAGLAGQTLSVNRGPLHLLETLRTGVNQLQGVTNGAYDHGPFPDDQVSPGMAVEYLHTYGCLTCHTADGSPPAGDAPDLLTHAASMSEAQILRTIQRGSVTGGMAKQPLSDADAERAAQMVRSLVPEGTRWVHKERESNVAHLLAQNIVDQVYAEATGSHLVLAHGFPRNEAQAATLSYLTDVFVQSGWSLRALLKTIALDPGFNTLAPADISGDPYNAPPVQNPWSETSPGECDDVSPSGKACNSVGDVVSRYSVPSVLVAWSSALRVARPADFSATGAVSRTYQGQMGRFQNFQIPERTNIDFPAILRYDERFSSCNPGGTQDWIHDLGTYAVAHTWTLADTLRAVKVRMHSTNVIDPGDETTLLKTFTDQTAGAGTYGSTYKATWEPSVRQYCGALLTAPQFLLRGLPDDSPATGFDVPPLDVGEPVDADGWCRAYGDLAGVGC